MKSGPKDTDESTDAYDTIDWLIKNVPGNTGKVGIWGISQPGFFATAAMMNSHPAPVTVSPQAPVTDYYLGKLVVDPWTHGGFAHGDGDRVGNVSFGSKTAAYFREKIDSRSSLPSEGQRRWQDAQSIGVRDGRQSVAAF